MPPTHSPPRTPHSIQHLQPSKARRVRRGSEAVVVQPQIIQQLPVVAFPPKQQRDVMPRDKCERMPLRPRRGEALKITPRVTPSERGECQVSGGAWSVAWAVSKTRLGVCVPVPRPCSTVGVSRGYCVTCRAAGHGQKSSARPREGAAH